VRVVVLVVLAACGRVGFDTVAAVAGDDAPFVCANGTPEACNGVDDNCDGVVDEGCSCTPQLTSIEGDYDYDGSIAWSGASFGIAIANATFYRAQFFAISGAKIGPVVLPTQERTPPAVDVRGIVWTGARYIAITQDFMPPNDTSRLRAHRVLPSGAFDGDAVTVALDAYPIATVRIPTGLAIVYSRLSGTASLLLELDHRGEVVRTQALSARFLTGAVAITDDELAIASVSDLFGGPSAMTVSRFDRATGAARGSPIPVGAGASSQPAIVWTGGSYALAWAEQGAGILFSEIVQGMPSAPVVLDNSQFGSGYPDLAWTGSSLVAAWEQLPSQPFRTRAVIAVLSKAGARVAGDRFVTMGGSSELYPATRLAVADGRVGVIWPESIESAALWMFAQLCD
jgi:hypothetical protein